MFPRRAPVPIAEPDICVCAAGPQGRAAAAAIEAGLGALGFVVAPGPAAEVADQPRLDAVRDAADVLVVLNADMLAALRDSRSASYAEVTLALRLGRVVVPVYSTPGEQALLGGLPAELTALSRQLAFRFDPGAARVSLAAIAHALSSDATLEDRKLERRARRAAWVVATVFAGVVAFFVLPPALRWLLRPAPTPPLPPLAVAWAGAVAADAATETGTLGERTAVRPGERVRLAFAASADGHAYVVTETAAGAVVVLFPEQTMRGASRIEARRTYQVAIEPGPAPAASGGGAETLRLFVSYDPLENLEELAEEPDARMTASERLELVTSSVSGLLDGRHAPGLRFARSRAGRLLDPALAPGALPDVLPLLRPGGHPEVRTAAIVRGAFSVLVEFVLTPAGGR